VVQAGRQFALSSSILNFGFAYLAAQNWIEQASPLMKQLSRELEESCSAAILQGNEVVFVAHIAAPRLMSVGLAVGSRLPDFHAAIGRVQLAALGDPELWRRLKRQPA
jgi:IclR family pca regulon transcriptional regulator